MEATHSFMSGLRGRVHHGEIAPDSNGLDWSGLHARLCAAHAARRELVAGDSRQRVVGGDFARWADTVRPALISSQRVNLNDSTDGKAVCPNAAAVAGHSKVGD
jgi:hypothetical protein